MEDYSGTERSRAVIHAATRENPEDSSSSEQTSHKGTDSVELLRMSKSTERKETGDHQGEIGDCLMGTKFLFGRMKVFGKLVGGGCTTLKTKCMPLNCALNVVRTASFMGHTFHHNFFNLKKGNSLREFVPF